jgi:hypothetical protein
MKTYPSIDGPSKAPHEPCVAFLKYDGSNIRVEWNRKTGFTKFGSRKQMFDETSQWFGSVIPIFREKWEDRLAKVLKTKEFRSLPKCTFFFEWFGEKSFAGWHDQDDMTRCLVLFDVNPHKKGIMGPREFINNFGHLEGSAEIFYEGNMNQPLIQGVMDGTLEGLESKLPAKQPVIEGVVCKGGSGHQLWMRKVKTAEWKAELKKRRPDDWEQFL